MKSFNKVTKVLVFTIVACLILSLIVPFANAKENGTITISKIDNGNLLFHDCNEEIEQNYYTPEDYEKLDYPELSDEWGNIFQAEHHERIEDTNNIEMIESISTSNNDSDNIIDEEEEEKIDPKVFDIKRYIDSKLISTTFMDGGYYTVLKVDNNVTKLVEADADTHGITCDIKGEFVSNDNYVKVSYIVKNNNSNSSKISLGTFSDIQIGTADDATVRRQADGSGIVMTDENTGLQFKFFGRNVADVTNVDTLWVGAYPFQVVTFFNNNDVNEFAKFDSAFAYSWQNRTIGAGETQVYSVLFGVDEVSAIPVVSLNEGQERYTSDNAEVSGKVTDLNKDEKGKIYFNVDNGNQIYLGKYQLNNEAISSVSEKNVVIGANTPIPEPEPEPEPEQPKAENKTVNNIISNSNRVVENNVKNTVVDNTMASKTLPYTGFGGKMGLAIFALLILARVLYVKYKKVDF